MARKMRDDKEKKSAEALKNNVCWNDLNALYQSCVDMLAQHTSISTFAKDIELIECVDDKATLVLNIKTLGRDITTLNSELKEIHKAHADKVGGADDPDDLMLSISIFEQYNLFIERHNAIIMPVAYHIVEILGTAEKKLKEKRMAALPKVTVENGVTVVEGTVAEVKQTNEATNGTEQQP